MKKLLCAAFALLLPLLAQAQTLVFTAIPDEDESRLQERFGKVAEYLSLELGVEVAYLPVKSYAAAVTAFRNNQVQLAWFGGLSGVRARQLVPGSDAVAQGFEDQFFKTYFMPTTALALFVPTSFQWGSPTKLSPSAQKAPPPGDSCRSFIFASI